MSSTIPLPPREQLWNRYCSNKQQQVALTRWHTTLRRITQVDVECDAAAVAPSPPFRSLVSRLIGCYSRSDGPSPVTDNSVLVVFKLNVLEEQGATDEPCRLCDWSKCLLLRGMLAKAQPEGLRYLSTWALLSLDCADRAKTKKISLAFAIDRPGLKVTSGSARVFDVLQNTRKHGHAWKRRVCVASLGTVPEPAPAPQITKICIT